MSNELEMMSHSIHSESVGSGSSKCNWIFVCLFSFFFSSSQSPNVVHLGISLWLVLESFKRHVGLESLLYLVLFLHQPKIIDLSCSWCRCGCALGGVFYLCPMLMILRPTFMGLSSFLDIELPREAMSKVSRLSITRYALTAATQNTYLFNVSSTTELEIKKVTH